MGPAPSPPPHSREIAIAAEVAKEADAISIVEGYPSTALIFCLLKELQRGVKEYSRHHKSSVAILNQSANVYETIVNLIQGIDENTDPAQLDWSAFTRSTDAVPALENFLLRLVFGGHDLPLQPGVADLVESVQFVVTWDGHRKGVTQIVTDLVTCVSSSQLITDTEEQNKLKSEVAKAQKADDIITLETVLEGLKSANLVDGDLLSDEGPVSYVTEVRATIEKQVTAAKALGEAYPESALGSAVAGVLLLYVPFLVVQAEIDDKKVNEHMRSARLWKEAKEFSNTITSFLQESPPNETSFAEKYEAFKAFLEKAMFGPLKAHIVNLIKAVAQVRRPFYGRSVALVKMWYEMNSQVALKNEEDDEAMSTVRRVLDSTAKAFNEAKTEITSFDIIFDPKIETLTVAYKEVLDEVKPLSVKYATRVEKDLQDMYDAAKKTDEDHLQQWRDKVSRVQSPPTKDAEGQGKKDEAHGTDLDEWEEGGPGDGDDDDDDDDDSEDEE